MAVSRKDVLQVAQLARLRLTPEEVDRFTAQLNGILAHVEELAEVDTAAVEGMGGATDGRAPLRPETAEPDALRIAVERLAPEWRERFFTVPRLAALDSADEEAFEDKARSESAGRPGPEDAGGAA